TEPIRSSTIVLGSGTLLKPFSVAVLMVLVLTRLVCACSVEARLLVFAAFLAEELSVVILVSAARRSWKSGLVFEAFLLREAPSFFWLGVARPCGTKSRVSFTPTSFVSVLSRAAFTKTRFVANVTFGSTVAPPVVVIAV